MEVQGQKEKAVARYFLVPPASPNTEQTVAVILAHHC